MAWHAVYRTPADALKEHVSNAIDEHLKARLAGTALTHCHVRFHLDRRHITIEYPYGMSRPEFESALQRVADSEKRSGSAGTIGRLGIANFAVTPSLVKLPRLLAELTKLHLPADAGKRVGLELYFDPSGRGRVAIQHRGVTVIEDLGNTTAYGLEESVYGQGSVRGAIDADFLVPLPSRSGFEENDDWVALLDLLDGYRKTLEAEVQMHLTSHRARQAADIQERALRIAREILDLDEFQDLALPTGLAKKRRKTAKEGLKGIEVETKKRKKKVSPPTQGDLLAPRGTHIRYEEVAFENNSAAHSRFVSGVVEANTLHPDYVHAARSVGPLR